MVIGKEFTFDSAHYLPDYKGNCGRLHGHTYKLEVKIQGVIQSDGMVMDFKELNKRVEEVIAELDHRCINEIIPKPTAENMIMWFQAKFHSLNIYSLKLWETPTSFVEYINNAVI